MSRVPVGRLGGPEWTTIEPTPELVRLLEGKKPQVDRGAVAAFPRHASQKQVRLSRQQQAELVQRQRDSAFKKELARSYGIHVDTARAIVRRASRG